VFTSSNLYEQASWISTKTTSGIESDTLWSGPAVLPKACRRWRPCCLREMSPGLGPPAEPHAPDRVVHEAAAVPPEREGAPEANWTVERVNDTHVAVTHAGGQPIRTGNLHVTVDGLERDTNFTDPVTLDQRTGVAACEGSVVRAYW
jgi:hypothetical protein